MKKIGIALLLLSLVVACGARKDAKSNDQSEIISDEEVENQLDKMNDLPEMDANGAFSSTGIIRDKSTENCGFLVEMIIEEAPKLFEPLNLDSSFCVEGMAVNLTYRLSRRPSTCLIAIPIVIDQITAK